MVSLLFWEDPAQSWTPCATRQELQKRPYWPPETQSISSRLLELSRADVAKGLPRRIVQP